MSRHGIDPEYFQVRDNDVEMSRAVQQARRSVGVFIKALRNPAPGQHDFAVKKMFVQGDRTEHIWLSHVTYTGNRFQGFVDNKPEVIQGLKLGMKVSVNPDEITDWAYLDHNKLVGGYTIRLLCNGCPPDRKQKLENQGDYRITNP